MSGKTNTDDAVTIYLAALREGENPTAAVMRLLGISRATARRRLHRARVDGLLVTPTHHAVTAEIGRDSKRYRRVRLCDACLTPWPCRVADQ